MMVDIIYYTCLAKGKIQREHSEDPWLGQSTDDIVETTVPSLLVPSLPNMEV
jgi:hypothetical protein